MSKRRDGAASNRRAASVSLAQTVENRSEALGDTDRGLGTSGGVDCMSAENNTDALGDASRRELYDADFSSVQSGSGRTPLRRGPRGGVDSGETRSGSVAAARAA